MKYTIKTFSDCNVPSYSTIVRNTYSESHTTEDIETIKKLISDSLDCADYDLTDENIKENFGVRELSQKNLSDIRNYYTIRKIIYGDFLKHLKDGITGVFRYDIPEEYNSFSVSDDKETKELAEKEKQFAYYVELSIEK